MSSLLTSTNITARRQLPFWGAVVFFLCGSVLGCQKPEDRGGPQAPSDSSQQPELRTFFPPGSATEVCFNAVDDNENGLLDEGCDVPQGLVQVALSWESDQDDFDLVVADPSGEIATKEAATSQGLSYLRDCPQDDACTEQPYELVFLEGSDAIGGTYSVLVRAELLSEKRTATLAHLGIKTPETTLAYELSFSEQRQEIRLQFDVASSEKKE